MKNGEIKLNREVFIKDCLRFTTHFIRASKARASI